MAGVCLDVLMLVFVLSECSVYSNIKSYCDKHKEENGSQQKDKINQICSQLVQITGHEISLFCHYTQTETLKYFE